MWEYAELEVEFSTNNMPNAWQLFIYDPDGKHQETKGHGGYGTQLAIMGEDGWEVTACNTRAAVGLVVKVGTFIVSYFLRRPK